MSCCKPTNPCSSDVPETCEALQTTTTGARVVVEDEANCKRTLSAPSTPSLLLYDANGDVLWRDGGSEQPISLPQLQSQNGSISKFVGQKSTGEIVGVKGTASPAENELFKWDGTNFVPVEISKQFGARTGVLCRDVAAPSLAQWKTPLNGQVLVGDASGNATWGSVPGTFPIGLAGGRLTLASGVPVMSSAVTTATVLYYTPYISDQIALYNGTIWTNYSFTERSISLAGLAADTNFDVFIYDLAGVLTLELTAWTNDTTRATALVRQNGVLVRSGAATRRYLGTIRTTGTIGQSEFSFGGLAVGGTAAKLFVWNQYNRQRVTTFSGDTTDSWSYGTVAWRAANNSSTIRTNFVVGQQEGVAQATYQCVVVANASGGAVTGIGYDSVTALAQGSASFSYVVLGQNSFSSFGVTPAPGFHYLSAIETAYTGNAVTFSGDSGTPTVVQGGIRVIIEM